MIAVIRVDKVAVRSFAVDALAFLCLACLTARIFFEVSRA